ncbi:MAG: glycosyltransferase family 4 protein [Roseivirga sp.]|nr:glycosyltransferase family 4 protein [Roseivirga sp.]
MKTSPLSILLICKSLPWKFNGGIQTHVWELSRALVAEGHQVAILTGGPYKQAEKMYDKEGVSIIEIPYFPGRYLKPVSMLAEELSFNLASKRWVRENHKPFNIIHAQGRSGYLLYSLSVIRPKLITTIHGLIASETKCTKWYDLDTRLHSLISSRAERKLIEGSRQCVAVSKDLKADLNKRFHQAKLNVIPNGVRFSPQRAGHFNSCTSRFLFVGRLHPIKGLAPLLTAMAKAPAHICLDIIGDGPQYAVLKCLIDRNRLGNRIRLLGAHNNESVHRTLPFYRALVLPSYYETQGIVLIESNAQAIPVIASDIPAIRETVEHGVNGLLCDPHDPASFIEAMKYYIKQPAAAQRMGMAGRERVIHRYSWDNIVNQTLSVYHKLAV